MFEKMMEKVSETAAAATDMATHSMNNLSETASNLKALGFSVRDVRMGMGIVPEIGAKLIGSIEVMDQDKIKKMIDSHRQDKVLVAVLEALRTASVFKEQLGDFGFKGVEADVTLGLPPKVSVRLMQTAGDPNV
jgi:hypothetical protein